MSLASVCWLALFGVRASPDAISQARCDTEAMAARAQILAVDDDHGFRAFVRAMLERDGFAVIEQPHEPAMSRRLRAVLIAGASAAAVFNVVTF